MSATDPLDDARLDRLSELLDSRAVPFKGFNLEALDGFLSALAVSPDTVPVEEWQPVVWGGKPPRWDAGEEAEVLALAGVVGVQLADGFDLLPEARGVEAVRLER